MANDNQRQMLRDQLAHLIAINPGHVDEFRMSKDESSIAHFPPDRETGALLYATYILDDDHIINCVVDGISLSVDKPSYEGFPDPPRAEPKFKVGDKVSLKPARLSGRKMIDGVWVNDWDEPARAGLVVTEVNGHQWSDRTWQYRVVATDPAGRNYNSIDCSESAYEKDES
jgi:hypothetical protein